MNRAHRREGIFLDDPGSEEFPGGEESGGSLSVGAGTLIGSKVPVT